MKISQLVEQGSKNLVIFDIDDTLLHTTAKINVVKDGEVVGTLDNQQFNNYTLKPGEEFDFGEFRSAEKFNSESQPIEPMVKKLKDILAHSTTSDVIMLTARADFDNRDLFLKTFTDLGIDMSRVYVHRAGNLPGDDIPAEKKAVIVRKYADSGKYYKIVLYDDSRTNLEVFKNLTDEYPDIDFRAYYVGPEGQAQNIAESISIKDHKENFVEMFKKFLPVAMKYIKLDHLPTMKFEAHIHDDVQPTFGKYENGEHVLYVALMNRHPNDILRTIAHELTHYKQDTEHQLNSDSGRTGSPIENEAHAIAGIVMRHFNKQYPEYLSSKPITESAAWQKSSGKNKNGGLNKKGVASYRREHPGSKLQTAVTTKPSKLKKGSKASKRRKSFCARMKGMKKSRTSAKTAHDPNSRINKSLRKWNCESVEQLYDVLQTLKENFADGKNPGRKGLAKRSGVNTKASVSSLRKTAKHSTGEKARMAHWLANMKAGRAKKKKS
jgi:FMN phosphatase YigB (HAD superfamily)